MQKILKKPFSYLSAFWACFVVALSTGCVSGGFKLTRRYAQVVNSQNIILRVLLYILTGVIFAVTLLIDVVLNNTMDFWNGTVAAGTYNFNGGGKTYVVKHEILPNRLKRSTIDIFGTGHKRLQEVVLQETAKGEIECYVDGKLRTRVQGISELPIATQFDERGAILKQEVLFSTVAQVENPLVR